MPKPVLPLLFTTIALGACTAIPVSGKLSDETRELPAFSSITLNGISTVRIHRGQQEVRVKIDAELVDRYEARVRGDTLILGFKCRLSNLWALGNLKTCEIDVTVPQLTGITINGDGEMLVDEFDYKMLELVINGAAHLELAGTAVELKAGCTGDCQVIARGLVAESGIISMTGSSRVELGVRESLSASITGAGELLYWGTPEVSRKITGAGIITRAGE